MRMESRRTSKAFHRAAGRWACRAACLALALAGLRTAPAYAQAVAADPNAAATIAGRVVSVSPGNGVDGAQVHLIGTTRSTSTGRDGSFRIGHLPAGTYTIRVHAPGYAALTQTVKVAAGAVVRPTLTLQPSPVPLDALVVTGRIAASERATAGHAIATIEAQPLMEAPISTLSQFLQARHPGLTVIGEGGKLGQGSRVVLRGVRTLSRSNDPVIFVDGIRIDNSAVNGLHSRGGLRTIGGESWAGLDDINPDDIERVEVLRGPAAASIFGTEAAGGVIQIFTKRGTGDRQRFDFRSEYGLSSTPASWWEATPHGSWFHDRYVRQGHERSHYLSVRGGTDRFDYYVGASLNTGKGVLPQNTNDYWSFRANMKATPSQSVAIGVTTAFSLRKIGLPYDGSSEFGITRNGLLGGELGVRVPPEEVLLYELGLKASRFSAGATLENVVRPNLRHRLSVGADIFNTDNIDHTPYGTQVIEGGKKISYRRHATTLTLDYLATLGYALSESVGAETSLGIQGMIRHQAYTMAYGYNFAGPGLSTVENAGTTDGDEDRISAEAAGVVLRQSVALRDRLFLGASLRVDGHSAFGADRRFQIYPGVSASHVLTGIGHLPAALSTLRLRAAYGAAGQPPVDFSARRTWISVPASENAAGLITGNIGNPEIHAEVTHEIEAGFDAGLFEDRLFLEFTYYDQRTRDALFPVFDAPSAGFPDAQLTNIGEIRNSGIEAMLTARILDGPDFSWSLRGGIFTNSNRVVSIGIGEPLLLGGTQWIREDHPVAAFFTDAGEYIGPAFPTRTYQFGTELTHSAGIRMSASLDHRGGHYLESHTLREIAQGGDPMVPVGDRGDFVFPADAWRLREVTLAYDLPQRWVRPLRLAAATVSVAGRNLWRSQDYEGLEAEASHEALQPLLNQVQFNTPIPRYVSAGIRIQF